MSDISVKISKPSFQIGIEKKEATVKITGEVIEMLNTDRFKFCQIPTLAPDGATKIFTTPKPYVAGTLTVYRDQSALLGGGKDFKELDPDTGTFEMTVAPDADEIIWSNYIIKV